MRDAKVGSILDNVKMLRDEWTNYAEGIEIIDKDHAGAKAFRRCIRDLSDIEHDLFELWKSEDVR